MAEKESVLLMEAAQKDTMMAAMAAVSKRGIVLVAIMMAAMVSA